MEVAASVVDYELSGKRCEFAVIDRLSRIFRPDAFQVHHRRFDIVVAEPLLQRNPFDKPTFAILILPKPPLGRGRDPRIA
jgi:hypothetical protein